MKKDIDPSYEAQLRSNRDLRAKYESPLIKWYDTNLTKYEKYKWGYMTYDEYVLWQKELLEKQQAGELESELDDSSDSNTSGSHTFWEDDDGDRENISASDYEAFLAANNIDVSNKNAIDGFL